MNEHRRSDLVDQPTMRHRRASRTALAIGVVIVALVAALGACSSSGDDLGLTGAAAEGQTVWNEKRCAGCHSADGGRSSGPTFEGLWGSHVTMTDGTEVTVDRDYIVSSIEEPSAQVVKGYAGVMPKIELTPSEIDKLIAFIQALG